MIFSLAMCFSGVTISGLESPLTVGHSTTITCSSNIAVDSIEWRAGSTVLDTITSSSGDLTELEYTIDVVMDVLTELTCVAMADKTIYNETEAVVLEGMSNVMNTKYGSILYIGMDKVLAHLPVHSCTLSFLVIIHF